MRNFAVAWFTASLAGGVVAGPLDTLQPGEWYEAPNTHMSAVDPCPAVNCSYSGTNGQMTVMTGWNSGVYDTKRDRLVVWGGGHAGYGGNELYAFDIATLSWIRVNEPTELNAGDPAPPNTGVYYHDGTPSQRHTYDALVYAPNVDRFFSMTASVTFGDSPQYDHAVDSFDFDTKTWKTNWAKRSDGGVTGVISAYDPINGTIWVHTSESGGRLGQFDPNAGGGNGAWTIYPNHIYLEIYGKALIDSKRHRMVSIGSYNGGSQLYVWDLNHPANPPTHPTTSGDATGIALEGANGPGFEYDPVSDLYVAWNGGTDVYTLNPDTWVWTRRTPAPTNTVAANKLQRDPSGTWGRFRYIPSKNLFVVVNSTTANVFFYKLTAGEGTGTGGGTGTGVGSGSGTTVTKGSAAGALWPVEVLLGALALAVRRGQHKRCDRRHSKSACAKRL